MLVWQVDRLFIMIYLRVYSVLYLRDKKTAFVLIPKNGSMSIRQSFVSNFELLTITNSSGTTVDNISIEEAIMAKLITLDNTFYGVIREPLERQLSLYLYRHSQNKYKNVLSIADFRDKMAEGYIKDKPWQTKLQTSFMSYNGLPVGVMWLYEDIESKFKPYCNLTHINRSHHHSKSTAELVSIFYDKKTKDKALEYWYPDVEAYERLKRDTRKSSN